MAPGQGHFPLKFRQIDQTSLRYTSESLLVYSNPVMQYQNVNKTCIYSYSCWDRSELYHLSAGYMGNRQIT